MGNYYFAPSCSACPYGRGPDYCKGECKWDYNEKKCVPKYSTGNYPYPLKNVYLYCLCFHQLIIMKFVMNQFQTLPSLDLQM